MAEPTQRFAHYAAPVGRQLYVFGGRAKDFSKDTDLDSIYTFDQYCEEWTKRPTTGTPPPGIYDGTVCTDQKKYVYLYGGFDGKRQQNALHQLDTDLLKWSQLPSGSTRKSGCGMVSYEDKLVLFGGYGIPLASNCSTKQEELDLVKSTGSGRRYSSELHCFDLQTGQWYSPDVKGIKPPPCSGFSFTRIGHHHAILFGGYDAYSDDWCNHVYILDLEKMEWSVLDQEKNMPTPVGRSDHAAVCMEYGECSQLFVYGGWDGDNTVLSDAWILDINTGKWKEVNLPISQPRCLHSATAFNINSEIVEITLFGGCPKRPQTFKSHSELPRMADTTILQFERGENTWHVTEMARMKTLSTERVRKKKELAMQQANHSASPHATALCSEEEKQQARQEEQDAKHSYSSTARHLMMQQYGLKEADCTRVVTDAHLEEFTRSYGENWEMICAHLELKGIVARDIDKKYGTPREKRYNFFKEWKSKKSSDATYEKLVSALLKIECRDDAEGLCKILVKSLASTTIDNAAFKKELWDKGIEKDLEQQLMKNHEKIGVEYASYVHCILTLLREKNLSVKELSSFIVALPYEFSQSTISELEKAMTIEEIFCTLTKYFSFWDFTIFQYLIEEFELDKSNTKLQYAERFQKYIENHKVIEFVKINPLLSKYEKSKYFKQVVLKFDINIVKCNLKKVDELRHRVANSLKVRSSSLRLVDIKEGCMEVTYLILASIADDIFTNNWQLVSSQVKELQAASVLSITCNNYTFQVKDKTLELASQEPNAKLLDIMTQRITIEEADNMLSNVLKEVASLPVENSFCFSTTIYLEKFDLCLETLERIVTDCSLFSDDLETTKEVLLTLPSFSQALREAQIFYTAPNCEGQVILEACKVVRDSSLKFFAVYKQESPLTEEIESEAHNFLLSIKTLQEKINVCKDEVMDNETSCSSGDMSIEISSSIQAIEAMRQKIQEKSHRAVVKELLDSCANFFEELECLLTCGDNLLKDIVKREIETYGEFHNGRWSIGLLSVVKQVVNGASRMIDMVDADSFGVVKYTDLEIAAQSITANTAQLVAVCGAKSRPLSDLFQSLRKSSYRVFKTKETLVKLCLCSEEEPVSKPDFVKMSHSERTRLKMEAKTIIFQLTQELEKERANFSLMRKEGKEMESRIKAAKLQKRLKKEMTLLNSISSIS